jgi:dienelactone hydrolase
MIEPGVRRHQVQPPLRPLPTPRQVRRPLFGHADEDRSNTPEQIAALDAALAEAGVTHRSEVYAGAHHRYTMSVTPVYDEAACERHFAALFDLLDRRAVC